MVLDGKFLSLERFNAGEHVTAAGLDEQSRRRACFFCFGAAFLNGFELRDCWLSGLLRV
jgi:hypothetical protein